MNRKKPLRKLKMLSPKRQSLINYFSESDPTEGQGDASNDGLSFVLMQLGQPVTFARRVLTLAERKHSQIEKELLAQVFGMEHNHHYVHGRFPGQITNH